MSKSKTPLIRKYINDSFSTEEKVLFDFLHSTFPESYLFNQGALEESEATTIWLGILSKLFGGSLYYINHFIGFHDRDFLLNLDEASLKSKNFQDAIKVFSFSNGYLWDFTVPFSEQYLIALFWGDILHVSGTISAFRLLIKYYALGNESFSKNHYINIVDFSNISVGGNINILLSFDLKAYPYLERKFYELKPFGYTFSITNIETASEALGGSSVSFDPDSSTFSTVLLDGTNSPHKVFPSLTVQHTVFLDNDTDSELPIAYFSTFHGTKSDGLIVPNMLWNGPFDSKHRWGDFVEFPDLSITEDYTNPVLVLDQRRQHGSVIIDADIVIPVS